VRTLVFSSLMLLLFGESCLADQFQILNYQSRIILKVPADEYTARVMVGNLQTGQVQICSLVLHLNNQGSGPPLSKKYAACDIKTSVHDDLGLGPYKFSSPSNQVLSRAVAQYQDDIYVVLSEASRKITFCAFRSIDDPYSCVSTDLK